MVKKILLGVLVIFVLLIAYVFMRARPSGDINKYQQYFVDETAPADSTVKVTFLGVSTLLIDDGETQILIDGFFSRPGMIKALTSDIASDTLIIRKFIDQLKMDHVKGVFVTHSHYDHGFDAGHVAKMTGATLYGSETTLSIGRGADLNEAQMQLYEDNKDVILGDFVVRIVPSKHSPGKPFDGDELIITEPIRQPASYKAYPQGGAFDFLISHHGRRMYIKPSPNFIEGALDSLDAEVVFLGIATITKQEPSWVDQFYKENVTALSPKTVVPIHWDNFFEPLTDHLVMLPKLSCDAEKDFDYFVERTKADNIDFKILPGTKSIIVFK